MIVCVVAVLVGVFGFVGAMIGLAVGRPLELETGFRVLVAVAAAGGILGVWVGIGLAWKLGDLGGPRRRLVWAQAGGFLGFGIGSLIPPISGLGFTAATPILAIACPGIGAVGGLVLCDGYYKFKTRRTRKK